jgi:hypothetical protein
MFSVLLEHSTTYQEQTGDHHAYRCHQKVRLQLGSGVWQEGSGSQDGRQDAVVLEEKVWHDKEKRISEGVDMKLHLRYCAA